MSKLAAGVITGRAVVAIFSVDEPGPWSVTGLLVKAQVEAVGKPVQPSEILDPYTGFGVSCT